MALVGRLAGAVLAQSGDDYFLIGDLKQPCEFAAAGFESPGEIEPTVRPYVKLKRLAPQGKVKIPPPCLELDIEGEALARLLAARFLIERNGSVSDRLWRLVVGTESGERVDARWLAAVPETVWKIVRDGVLKCS
jgi:hypothetical protein